MKYGNAVKGVRPFEGYAIRVVFNDGFIGDIDLEALFQNARGPMTEPFKQADFFRRVAVDPENEVVCWPNGYDICSDVLRYYCELGRVASREELAAHFETTAEKPASLALKEEPKS